MTALFFLFLRYTVQNGVGTSTPGLQPGVTSRRHLELGTSQRASPASAGAERSGGGSWGSPSLTSRWDQGRHHGRPPWTAERWWSTADNGVEWRGEGWARDQRSFQQSYRTVLPQVKGSWGVLESEGGNDTLHRSVLSPCPSPMVF